MNKNNDLWVFGDSFATSDGQSNDWFSLLVKKFSGNEYFNYYCPSRDIQTIMDTFYSNLYKINDESLVIIWLPSLARIRYPKNKKYFNKLHESSYVVSGDETPPSEYFVHWPYDDFPNGTPKKELDFPFNTFDYNHLNKNNKVNYSYKTDEGQEMIQHALNDGIRPVDFSKLLNANDATAKNWTNIIESLKKYCKFEILFVSWTDEYKSDLILGKSILTEKIGLWHTQHMDYVETNGKSGNEWDDHFSTKMHKKFSNWVIETYPKYFDKSKLF
jgi:hypothetical protein